MKFYQIAKLVQFNFTNIDPFLWGSLGKNVKCFDFNTPSVQQENSDLEGSIYVNPKGDILYGFLSLPNPTHSESIVWIHPQFKDAFLQEHIDRSVSFNEEQATVLENELDFLTKVLEHTVSDECNIAVNLENDLINYIAMEAHKSDITFNDMVNKMLESQLNTLLKNKADKELPDSCEAT